MTGQPSLTISEIFQTFQEQTEFSRSVPITSSCEKSCDYSCLNNNEGAYIGWSIQWLEQFRIAPALIKLHNLKIKQLNPQLTT